MLYQLILMLLVKNSAKVYHYYKTNRNWVFKVNKMGTTKAEIGILPWPIHDYLTTLN